MVASSFPSHSMAISPDSSLCMNSFILASDLVACCRSSKVVSGGRLSSASLPLVFMKMMGSSFAITC